MYRKRSQNRIQRWVDKRNKKRDWQGEKFAAVIFCPPTPGRELRKRLQEAVGLTGS